MDEILTDDDGDDYNPLGFGIEKETAHVPHKRPKQGIDSNLSLKILMESESL